MKKIFALILLFVVGIVCFYLFRLYATNAASSTPKTQLLTIGKQQLHVEIAQTNSQITLGLGERDVLGSDGMLFVMPSRSIPAFWMKGMRFDLDFVWIDGVKVVDITQNVSAQKGSPENELRVYSPQVAVTHVLELNAGEVGRRGISIGDEVFLVGKVNE